MNIDVVDSIPAFDALYDDWDVAYAADPNTTVFVSWPWLRSYLSVMEHEWFVLAVRPNSGTRYVAFLPFIRVRRAKGLVSRLNTGGAPIADYTGLVCMPEYQSDVVTALSSFLADALSWDELYTGDTIDERWVALCCSFSKQRFRMAQLPSVACPYIELPGTWNEYLLKALGRSSRQSLKRRMRKLSQTDGYHISHTSPDNFTENVNNLLLLWECKWGAPPIDFTALFDQCLRRGCLWLDMIYIRETPVAGMAAFVDPVHKQFAYFISGYNQQYEELSPGRVIVAHSIRYAIEHEFAIYDFLRGDEAYKYTFGATKRCANASLITRNNLKNSVMTQIRQWRGMPTV